MGYNGKLALFSCVARYIYIYIHIDRKIDSYIGVGVGVVYV